MKELSKEDKERIEKEAISTQPTKTFIESIYRTMFERGAKYEHPIAFQQGETKGFNEGIEAAKNRLKPMKDLHGDIYSNLEYILDELEKLKK